MMPPPLHPPRSRDALRYLAWLARNGYRTPHLERVRAALTDKPQTRRQLARRASVSLDYAATATATLVALGEAEEAGTRGRHRALAYRRRKTRQEPTIRHESPAERPGR